MSDIGHLQYEFFIVWWNANYFILNQGKIYKAVSKLDTGSVIKGGEKHRPAIISQTLKLNLKPAYSRKTVKVSHVFLFARILLYKVSIISVKLHMSNIYDNVTTEDIGTVTDGLQ